MEKIKIYLVEDHPLHVEKARFLIDKLGYHMCGTSEDGEHVVRDAKLLSPDVFILDIELSGSKTGIEVAKELRDISPATPIIFLTSRTEVEVFEKARDTMPEAYLQKPMTEDAIKHAIELAVFRGKAQSLELEQNLMKQHTADVVFLKVGDALKKVTLADIVHIEVSYKNYCDIHTMNGTFAVKSSLKELEATLSSIPLIRVHRTAMVNVNFIEEINEKLQLVKTALGDVPLGNSFKKDLKKAFRSI